jgi:hypothetical protein
MKERTNFLRPLFFCPPGALCRELPDIHPVGAVKKAST